MRRLSLRGACNAGCLLLAAAAYLLVTGGQGVYTGLTNRTPTVLTITDYVDNKPEAKWLEVTDCYLDLTEAAYLEENGRMVEIYVPLRENPESEKVHLVLATDDSALMGLLKKMQKVNSEQQALEFLTKHKDEVFQQRSVNGLVRYGVDLDEEDRGKLRALDKALVSNFAIIDEGAEPALGTSLLMLVGGLILGVLTFLATAGSKNEEE